MERIVRDTDDIIAEVESYKRETLRGDRRGDGAGLRAVAAELIATYSTRSAIAGGLTALPAMVPGSGFLLAVVGASMLDMTWMLKHEVELSLALTHLYGHDIRQERERWLAYMLATVSTHQTGRDHNYFTDLAEAQLEAVSKYTPRQLSKMVVTLLGQLAVRRITRGALRGIPLLGIIVGASANKLMTRAVGWRCVAALSRRRRAELADGVDVVDARVR